MNRREVRPESNQQSWELQKCHARLVKLVNHFVFGRDGEITFEKEQLSYPSSYF